MAKPEKKKKVSDKEHDSSKYIDLEPTLDEAAKGTAVVAWGRMNPMTAGHEKLVKKVMAVAKSERGQPEIYLTHSFDKKKNPLAYDTKIRYAQKAFGPIVKKSTAKTIFQLMKQLETRFNRVILVAGSDRVTEFNNTLNKYNGKEYKFDEIKVVSAGQRDEESDDVSGISGTKMRGYAATDMKKFTANLPKRIQGDAEEIASLVRKGMNMSESEEIHIDDMEPLEERVLTRQQRRQIGLRMKKNRHKMARGRERAKRKTASIEVLKKRARKAALKLLKQKFAKNRRYAEMSAGEKEVIDRRISKINKNRIATIARKLLPKVKEQERARKKSLVSKRNESLDNRFEAFMEDYYKGVPKDKKDDREAHFKKYAERGDSKADKDSNYKPAPGDFKDGKRVKTKLSKHTKKFRDMYGEAVKTIKVGESSIGADSTTYAHVMNRKILALGEKDDMLSVAEQKGGRVWVVSAENQLGDLLEASGADQRVDWVCGNCHCEPCMCESDNLNEGLWGKYTLKKRPHMLMDQQGRVKFDKRFKMYKKNEDLNIESLMSLTEEFAQELNENPTTSLKKKAEKTGMPMGILRKVYNRGVAAWKSGHRPGTTPEQWGHARVNSFVTKSSGTWGKADSDLAAKVRKSKKNEETEIDELSLSVKNIKKSGLSNTNKAMNKDKIKNDLKSLRDRLNKKAVNTKPALDEKLDRTQYHTSVERGVFGKHSSDGNKEDYLLDLDNKAGGKKDGPPMLVTFGKEADAKKAQKKFGGKIVKTTFGTYRIKK